MGEKEGKGGQRRSRPSLVWPLILITAGVLFLLSNLGMLEINLWELWRLWPVLLVLAGLDILFGHRSFVGSLVVSVIALLVVGGVVLLLVAAPDVLMPGASGGVDRITEPLGNVERAQLRVDFAAGTLTTSKLVDSPALIEGDLKLATQRKPAWAIERSDSQADMTLEYKGSAGTVNWQGGDEWDLRLSPKATWSLDLDVGAGSATLDLGGLAVSDLTLGAGAGQTTVIFPDVGHFSAKVSGGVGQLILEIPEAMAVRVEIDRGLSALSLPARFSKRGDLYVTEGWDSSENRLDLQISIGVGQVWIREP